MNTVRETLSLLSPPPRSIHTSLIDQSISVEHSSELSVRAIKDALDGAGFDLVMTPDAEEYHLERSKLTFSSDWLSRKRQKHAEQCLLCKEEGQHANSQARTISSNVSAQYSQCRMYLISLTSSIYLMMEDRSGRSLQCVVHAWRRNLLVVRGKHNTRITALTRSPRCCRQRRPEDCHHDCGRATGRRSHQEGHTRHWI